MTHIREYIILYLCCKPRKQPFWDVFFMPVGITPCPQQGAAERLSVLTRYYSKKINKFIFTITQYKFYFFVILV